MCVEKSRAGDKFGVLFILVLEIFHFWYSKFDFIFKMVFLSISVTNLGYKILNGSGMVGGTCLCANLNYNLLLSQNIKKKKNDILSLC